MLSLSHCAWVWKWKSDRKIKSDKEAEQREGGGWNKYVGRQTHSKEGSETGVESVGEKV